MNIFDTRTRAAVKREHAHYYLLLTLLSFAVSVVLIRLFLKLTGFPQFGSGGLHIAHVLWGGLLLFLAGLLALIVTNRWVQVLIAVLSGVGVGLFIDEVGKFITQNNDYFSPLAAPIIYGLFLVVALVYLRVRRRPGYDARTELYYALDTFQEMLDHDLDEEKQAELDGQLGHAADSGGHPAMARFAQNLLDYFKENVHEPPKEKPGILERIADWLRKFQERYLPQQRLKVVLALGLLLSAVAALVVPALMLLGAAFSSSSVVRSVVDQSGGTSHGIPWLTIGLVLEGIVGLLLLFASISLLTGAARRGAELGYYGLLFSLTTANLLTFYFDQYGNVVLVFIQLITLGGLVYYRGRFIKQDEERRPDKQTSQSSQTPGPQRR